LLLVISIVVVAVSESDFPPPPMPLRPIGFNVYCDVCDTMMRRVSPYCDRDEANLDYLPDFCVFNYNKVLRLECEYLVDVMEFSWCPSPCTEIRKLKAHASHKLCHSPLVNCTERVYVPSPSPSPSPSASMPLPRDCVLCEYVLKQVAVMCMNEETANKKTIYNQCMERTWNKGDFDHCMQYLNQLVELAGTSDPCEMLTCESPRVACTLDSRRSCHVDHYTGPAVAYTRLGLDENGNFLNPDNSSVYHQTLGMGPGDFHPGQDPYNSPLPIRHTALPPRARLAGGLVEKDEATVDTTPAGIAAAESKRKEDVATEMKVISNQPAPAAIPLAEIK